MLTSVLRACPPRGCHPAVSSVTRRCVATTTSPNAPAWLSARCGWSVLDESLIRLSGPTASAWLQGLTTLSMDEVAARGHGYTAFLNFKGRVVADALVARVPDAQDTFVLSVARSRAITLLDHLQMLNFRRRVAIEPAEQGAVVAAIGLATPSSGALITLGDPRSESLGTRVLSLDSAATTVFAANDRVPALAFDLLRVVHGLPSSAVTVECASSASVPTGAELSGDRALPLEVGLDRAKALNFTKGCYLGQEVLARHKHQGVVRKKLFAGFLTATSAAAKQHHERLRGLSDYQLPSEPFHFPFLDTLHFPSTTLGPVPVMAGGAAVGQLHSIHYNAFTAQLRVEAVEDRQTPLTCNVNGRECELVLVDPEQ